MALSALTARHALPVSSSTTGMAHRFNHHDLCCKLDFSHWPYIIPRRIAVVTNAMGTFCVSSVAENDLQKVALEKNLEMVSEASRVKWGERSKRRIIMVGRR
jgi:hypothetical protein